MIKRVGRGRWDELGGDVGVRHEYNAHTHTLDIVYQCHLMMIFVKNKFK
jgi:hypothetical protein